MGGELLPGPSLGADIGSPGVYAILAASRGSMYGTVARMRLKPGVHDQFVRLLEEFRQVDASVAGFRAEVAVRTARDPDEYLLTVVFESEAAYRANAQDPAQHERYLRYRKLLASDPEWHDGDVVYATF